MADLEARISQIFKIRVSMSIYLCDVILLVFLVTLVVCCLETGFVLVGI